MSIWTRLKTFALTDVRTLWRGAPAHPAPQLETRATDVYKGGNAGLVGGGWLGGDRAQSKAQGHSVYAFQCMYLISVAVASTPIGAVDAATEEELPDHPLSHLLAKPNKSDTAETFWARVVAALMTGNAIITKARGVGGLPVDLTLHIPGTVTQVIEDGVLIRYETRKGTRTIPIPLEDVIHLKYAEDPNNPWWGIGPLDVAAGTVETDLEAVNWNRTSFKNRCEPSGMMVYKKELNDTLWLHARVRLAQMFMGSSNARMPMVLGNEVKWTRLSDSPVDMDMMNGRKMNREEICVAYGVPLVLLGILDAATMNNYASAREQFWQDNIRVRLASMSGQLTRSLAPDYVAVGPPVAVAYDTSDNEILTAVTPEKITVAEGLWGMGMPMSHVNDRLNLRLPAWPGWDVSYLPSSVVSADVGRINAMGEGEGEGDAPVIDVTPMPDEVDDAVRATVIALRSYRE